MRYFIAPGIFTHTLAKPEPDDSGPVYGIKHDERIKRYAVSKFAFGHPAQQKQCHEEQCGDHDRLIPMPHGCKDADDEERQDNYRKPGFVKRLLDLRRPRWISGKKIINISKTGQYHDRIFLDTFPSSSSGIVMILS